MNICKFRNVYDATPVANAAQRKVYDEYALIWLLFLCLHRMHMLSQQYFTSCTPRRAFHVMTELELCCSGHWHYKGEKGCIRLALKFIYNFAFERFQFDPRHCNTLKVK